MTEVGIVDITDKEHRALKHPSISELGLIKRAPILFKDKYIDGKIYESEEEDSWSLKIGTALHAAILEPKKFEAQVRMIPKGLRLNTRDGIAFKEKYIWPGEAQGELYIREEDYNHVKDAAITLFKEAQVNALLTGISPEKTFLFKPDGTTLCKARLDGHKEGMVIDLKSTRDIMKFEKSIVEYGYHRQAAFYCEAFKQVFGVKPKFYWIAVEQKPPYLYRVLTPSEDMLSQGEHDYMEVLSQFKECVITGHWPGTFKGVEEAQFPAWFKTTEKTLAPWPKISKGENTNGVNET